MEVLRVFILLFGLTSFADAARILAIFPMVSYSHYILGNKLLKELAAKGHEITMISPYQQKNPTKNFKDIVLTGFQEEAERRFKGDMFAMDQRSLLQTIKFMSNMTLTITELTLDHPNVKKLLNSGEKFDLVIVEQFMNEAHRGLQFHYGAPCIVFSTVGTNIWTNHLVGNPSNPAYIPELMSNFPPRMNIIQRTMNLVMRTMCELTAHLYNLPKQNEILHKYFPEAPHLYDLMYNTSLILVNSHPSSNQPIPRTPNIIEIGGFHVEQPKKLPEDLQKYLDGAKEGVVYFSMGSNLKSKDLPKEKRQAILKVFSGLKVKVLWKWEEDNLPGKPANVKIGKWLPQQDILAHPNVKLFITHGGLLSTIEAIYHGVPVIGIPIFGDQKINMASSVNNGFGIAVPYQELTEETLGNAIKKMLSDPSYRENAQRRSRIMHDQPVKPLDNAVFWVEHVLRHKGADHFRSSALDLTWYQLLYLDVLAVVLAVSGAGFLGFCLILRKIFCKNCSMQVKPKPSESKKKKQN